MPVGQASCCAGGDSDQIGKDWWQTASEINLVHWNGGPGAARGRVGASVFALAPDRGMQAGYSGLSNHNWQNPFGEIWLVYGEELQCNARPEHYLHIRLNVLLNAQKRYSSAPVQLQCFFRKSTRCAENALFPQLAHFTPPAAYSVPLLFCPCSRVTEQKQTATAMPARHLPSLLNLLRASPAPRFPLLASALSDATNSLRSPRSL